MSAIEDMDAQKRAGPRRFWMFLLFFTCWLLILLVSVLLRDSVPVDTKIFLRLGLATVFLGAAIVLRRRARLDFQRVFYAFFVVTSAFFISWKFSMMPLDWLSLELATPEGHAVAKLSEALWSVLPVIILVKISGGDMASIYLRKGRLGKSLIIGLLGFCFFAATAFFAAEGLFNARDLTIERAVPWIPWILIFVLSNGVYEELMFRGLFLKRLEPFLKPGLSNVLIAMVFVIFHMPVKYSADLFAFLVIVFFLALLWGRLTQRTDSLWGSVLIHAGADIPVIIGIFSNLS